MCAWKTTGALSGATSVSKIRYELLVVLNVFNEFGIYRPHGHCHELDSFWLFFGIGQRIFLYIWLLGWHWQVCPFIPLSHSPSSASTLYFIHFTPWSSLRDTNSQIYISLWPFFQQKASNQAPGEERVAVATVLVRAVGLGVCLEVGILRHLCI